MDIPKTHLMFESDKGLLALLKPTLIFRMDSGEVLANPILNNATDQAT